MNTAKAIMEHLQQMAEEPGAIDAEAWLRGAMKLRVLLQAEQEKLVDMERNVQEIKAGYLFDPEGKVNATAAKIKVETTDEFVEAKKQEVFIKTALDTILLAKKYATVETDIYKSM
jgi:hypothetical protein